MVKTCNWCGLEKSLSSFHNSQRFPDGKARVCKICMNEYNRKKKKSLPKDILPRLSNIRKVDWCNLWELFRKLGYDTSRSIHEQFCEKHNLPTKEFRGRKIKNRVEPNEC